MQRLADLAKPEGEVTGILGLLEGESFIDNQLIVNQRDKVRVAVVWAQPCH